MEQQPMRVAIIGGGIGGLAAAVALRRKGIEVTVHEQAPELGEVGAGVQIAPNGFRLLERFGLGQAVTDVAVRFQEGSSYYRQNGESISPSVLTDSTGWNALFGIHRADFLDLLAAALPAGVVHTGHRAAAFSQDADQATVTFENGDTVTADVVVGADGIHSVLRPHVVQPTTPTHSGMVAYRGLVPSAAVPTWRRDIWQMWLAQTERKHFLVFPVRRGELFNYVGFVPSTEETLESWTAQGNPDRLRAEFAEWDPRIVDLLSHVEHTFWWQMNDREPISRWTNGRLTLLGDAAHPMLPHLGQGANQALEDCAALATILAHSGRAEVGTALLSYESLRKERAAYVQTSSRANGLRYDATEATADRDVEISEASGLRWSLYDYDAEAAAEALFA